MGSAALTSAGLSACCSAEQDQAFGSQLTVAAADVPPVGGPPFRNIQGKFFLVHNEDGLLALYTKCPHLGCTVPGWDRRQRPAFQCPCHGSMYTTSTAC